MKPILFNIEMVRAIQNGTKTETRRVVKDTDPDWDFVGIEERPCERRVKADGTEYPKELDWPHAVFSAGDGYCDYPMRKAPYYPGDILYVRETWANLLYPDGHTRYVYKATDTYPFGEKMVLQFRWHPSIHMPREAARIFLRVTDVKVQRVQDITDEECIAEGILAWTKDGKLYKYYPADCEGDFPACDWQNCPKTPKEAMRRIWNDCYANPRPVKVKGVIDHYESYPWEDIQETRTYRGKPWYVIGNPWVWVIEFEQCEKPEESA